jgi:hypothetical protein
MKMLIVKATLVLVVILFSETVVYAHEPYTELPLTKDQLFRLAKSRITCSAVFIRAFPDEDSIAEWGNEIVSAAIDTFNHLDIGVSDEDMVELAQDGFDMWEGSSSEGRFDLVKMCGQDLLKTEVKKYNSYMPPDTHVFM